MNEKFPNFIDDIVDENIFCPHCGQMMRNDDGQYPVHYWGTEDGPVEKECESCDEKFYITECVTRTYDVKKTKEE
jgi:hypothetical protein